MALSLLVLAACDTMISHRIRITAVATQDHAEAPAGEAVVAFVRDTLSAQGMKKGPHFVREVGEVWEWKDPNNPPGLRATIEPLGAGSVQVRLSQGLYGPIGETDKYKSVKQALIDGGRRRFGRKSVQVG